MDEPFILGVKQIVASLEGVGHGEDYGKWMTNNLISRVRPYCISLFPNFQPLFFCHVVASSRRRELFYRPALSPGPRLDLSRAGGLILCACDRIRTTERVDSDDRQSFSLMRDDASHSDLRAPDPASIRGESLSVNGSLAVYR